MLYSQESKFDCVAGQLVNRSTGDPIPNDEPVFVLRAKDLHALTAIRAYIAVLENPEHREAVARRAEQFEQFAEHHPERMKVPDTARSCVYEAAHDR